MIQVIYSPQKKMAKTALARVLKGREGERADFDLSEVRLCEVADACDSVSLSGERKIIVASDISFLCKARERDIKYLKDDEPEAFYRYLEAPNDETDLFLLCVAEEMPRSGKLYDALSKGGAKVSEVKTYTKSEWLDYIPRYLSKRGSDIEAAAAEELYNRTSGDYACFLMEAGKLLNYADGRTISLDDIEKLVAQTPDDDAFHLYDAILARDKARAFALYRNIARKGSGQEVTLISLLGSQFRFLLACLGYRDQGLNDSQISTDLKCNPYRVKMAFQKAKGWGANRVSEVLNGLAEAASSVLLGTQKAPDAFFLFLEGAMA